jgi:hypothetical protein
MEYNGKQLVLGTCGPNPGIPTLLHVCRESREFTLTLFRLGFQRGDKFYWSPTLDTICLGLTFNHYSLEKLHGLQNKRECNKLWQLDNENLLSHVQHLALPLAIERSRNSIPFAHTSDDIYLQEKAMKFISRFSALKTVKFIKKNGKHSDSLEKNN